MPIYIQGYNGPRVPWTLFLNHLRFRNVAKVQGTFKPYNNNNYILWQYHIFVNIQGDLLGDIGGFLGMFLGWSCLSILTNMVKVSVNLNSRFSEMKIKTKHEINEGLH